MRPKLTSVAPVKPVPMIAIVVPPAVVPALGTIPVTDGGVAIEATPCALTFTWRRASGLGRTVCFFMNFNSVTALALHNENRESLHHVLQRMANFTRRP